MMEMRVVPEAAGLGFVPENGDEPGVRLRKVEQQKDDA